MMVLSDFSDRLFRLMWTVDPLSKLINDMRFPNANRRLLLLEGQFLDV